MGVGSGYAQADVEALARILTGVGIDLKQEEPNLKPELRPQLVREGAFEFNPARHDYGDKTFLGHTIKGSGAMFGFSSVTSFTHLVENLFDEVRKGKIPCEEAL